MTSSLKRRLDKLGSELPTFEKWLEQLYSAEKGPPNPRRQAIDEMYLKKFQEKMVAILAAREGRVPKVVDPEDDPPS
jgi:hypothetical protein